MLYRMFDVKIIPLLKNTIVKSAPNANLFQKIFYSNLTYTPFLLDIYHSIVLINMYTNGGIIFTVIYILHTQKLHLLFIFYSIPEIYLLKINLQKFGYFNEY